MTSPVLGPRLEVEPPASQPRQYGLVSSIGVRTIDDAHWRNGVWWKQTCGTGGRTPFQACISETGATGVTAKSANIDTRYFSAHPIVAYAEIECSLVGYDPAVARRDAFDALARVEEYQLEQGLWTGEAPDGTSGRIMPALTGATEVLDPFFSNATEHDEVTLQLAVNSLSPTGAPLDIVEALGRLEDEMGDCVLGVGVIHMTQHVADLAQAHDLLVERNGRKYTALGNQVVIGAGYPGTGPAGLEVADVHWMYATGPMFIIRGNEEALGADVRDYFDRATNTVKVIIERVFVVGFGCCLLGVPVSLGGVVGGAPDSRS